MTTNPDELSEVLLPCPFCGGTEELTVEEDQDEATYWMVCCSADACGCTGPMAEEEAGETRADAIQRWNRRAPMRA